jgi:hypothetical protein
MTKSAFLFSSFQSLRSFLNGYSLHHAYPVPGSSCEAFPLCHGAVFKIRALNLDKHPLPSYRLLKWQYHLHDFAAVFKAGGKVDTLYKGPKPPPDGPAVLCPRGVEGTDA